MCAGPFSQEELNSYLESLEVGALVTSAVRWYWLPLALSVAFLIPPILLRYRRLVLLPLMVWSFQSCWRTILSFDTTTRGIWLVHDWLVSATALGLTALMVGLALTRADDIRGAAPVGALAAISAVILQAFFLVTLMYPIPAAS